MIRLARMNTIHYIQTILPTVKNSSHGLWKNTFQLPLVDTECFKNCFVSRLYFNLVSWNIVLKVEKTKRFFESDVCTTVASLGSSGPYYRTTYKYKSTYNLVKTKSQSFEHGHRATAGTACDTMAYSLMKTTFAESESEKELWTKHNVPSHMLWLV